MKTFSTHERGGQTVIRPGQRKPYVKATRRQIDERVGFVARLLAPNAFGATAGLMDFNPVGIRGWNTNPARCHKRRHSIFPLDLTFALLDSWMFQAPFVLPDKTLSSNTPPPFSNTLMAWP